MTDTPCPYCKGRCCIHLYDEDDKPELHPHGKDEHWIHACCYCEDGTLVPLVWDTLLVEPSERAAVVAWLREEAEAAAQTYTEQAGEWAKRIDDMADAIERGEHRRQKEENE